MTRPLSVDLRDRVARYVLAGHSRRHAARVFGIGVSSAIRYVAQFLATGTVRPAKQGGDRRGKLKMHKDYLLRRVAEVPDISLQELGTELEARGLKIHPSNVSRFLSAQGLTYKKNIGRIRTEEVGRPAATHRVDQRAPADHAPGDTSPGVSR
jgi:transposase